MVPRLISPESCSSILWRSWEYKEQAAEALKLTASDMKKLKLVDQVVKEPLGGAHSDKEGAYGIVAKAIDKEIKAVVNESAEFSKESPEPALEELWTDIYA